MRRDGKTGHLSKPKLFNVKLCLMRNTDHKNDTYLSTPVCMYIPIDTGVESGQQVLFTRLNFLVLNYF